MSVVLNALICGLIWSVMWSIYVFMILKFYPFSMLHDYPKDIQAAATVEKPTRAQEQAAKRFGAVGGLIIFGVLLLFGLFRFHSEQASFWQVLKYIFIIAMTWNVVDLLIMDWLIVCTITPKWIIIKGTEGCKGYKDYFFHFKGFLLGCVYTTIMALLFSGIDYAVLRFLIWE